MPSKDRYNLVIGLAGPYGSGCSSVATEFERKVEDWPGCHVVKIRVSELIAKWYPIIIKEDLSEASKGNEKRRILQKAGTRLRDHDVEIIGKIVSFEVRRSALELESSGALVDKDILVFIVDSLKNRNDVKTLERIYGDEFYFCFIHANQEFRWRRMIDYKSWQEGERAEFQELDKIDSNEKDVRPEVGDTGQQVKLLAQMADYFIVNNINREKLRKDVDRLLNLLIGNGPNQPTIHERSMHMAFSASNRSCCLSRQVGAAIFDKQGSLIGIGHNDVPKAGGSLYALEDQSDSRCFVMGDLRCINETNKQERFDKLSDRIYDKLENQAGEGRLKEFIEKSGNCSGGS